MVETIAAVARGPHVPVQIEPITLDTPRPDEVVVRMVAAGLCHTDLSGFAGHLPFPLPGVLGHEGAGIVEQVGSAVGDLSRGQPVLLSYTSCGACGACRTGTPAWCEHWLWLNLIGGGRSAGRPRPHDGNGGDGNSNGNGEPRLRDRDGQPLHGQFFGQSSFSALALVDRRSVVPLEPAAQCLPLELLAPLGCGVQTGAGTVFNVLRPGLGATLVVIGVGTVGLSAVMAAALTPATRIIAADRVPERLALAKQLGATDTIDLTGTDLRAALDELTGGRGVPLAMDTTAAPDVVTAAAAALTVGGTLALVGAPPPGTTVPVDLTAMLSGRSIVGVTEGSCDPAVALPPLIELYRQGRFPVDRLVRSYPLADIQTAADDMLAGRTIKPVLHFDGIG